MICVFILAHIIKSDEGWSIFEPQENSSEFPVVAGTYLTEGLLEENGTARFLLAVFLSPSLPWSWSSLSSVLAPPQRSYSNPAPPSGVRYPIWFNSMFEFCQKMIHSIFDSIIQNMNQLKQILLIHKIDKKGVFHQKW